MKLNPLIESVTVYFPYPTDDPYKEGFGYSSGNDEYIIRLQRFFDEMCADKKWTQLDASAAGAYGEDGVRVIIPLWLLEENDFKGWTFNRVVKTLKKMYDKPIPPNARRIENRDADYGSYSYHYVELTKKELREERLAYDGEEEDTSVGATKAEN